MGTLGRRPRETRRDGKAALVDLPPSRPSRRRGIIGVPPVAPGLGRWPSVTAKSGRSPWTSAARGVLARGLGAADLEPTRPPDHDVEPPRVRRQRGLRRQRDPGGGGDRVPENLRVDGLERPRRMVDLGSIGRRPSRRKGVIETRAVPVWHSSVSPPGMSGRRCSGSTGQWAKSRSRPRCAMTHGWVGSGQGRCTWTSEGLRAPPVRADGRSRDIKSGFPGNRSLVQEVPRRAEAGGGAERVGGGRCAAASEVPAVTNPIHFRGLVIALSPCRRDVSVTPSDAVGSGGQCDACAQATTLVGAGGSGGASHPQPRLRSNGGARPRRDQEGRRARASG